LHDFNPGDARGTGSETAFTQFKLPENYALEHGVYAMGEEKIGYRLSVKYGLRLAAFQNIGPADIFGYDQNFEVQDTITYNNREIFNTYIRLEPRFGLNYTLNDNTSIKASYAR